MSTRNQPNPTLRVRSPNLKTTANTVFDLHGIRRKLVVWAGWAVIFRMEAVYQIFSNGGGCRTCETFYDLHKSLNKCCWKQRKRPWRKAARPANGILTEVPRARRRRKLSRQFHVPDIRSLFYAFRFLVVPTLDGRFYSRFSISRSKR